MLYNHLLLPQKEQVSLAVPAAILLLSVGGFRIHYGILFQCPARLDIAVFQNIYRVAYSLLSNNDAHIGKGSIMDNIEMIDILNIIGIIIGLFGGAAGILAWFKAPNEIRKTKADAYKTLEDTIAGLSETVKAQGEQIKALKETNEELEKRVDELEDENKTLVRGVNRLVNQIRKLGQEPVWTPPQKNDIIE